MLEYKYLFIGIDPSITVKKTNTNHNGIAFIESNNLLDLSNSNFYVDILDSSIDNFNSEYEYLIYVFDCLISKIVTFLQEHKQFEYVFIGIEEYINQINLSEYNTGKYSIDTGSLVDKFIYEAKSILLKKTNVNVNIYKCLRREVKYFTNQYLTKMGYIYLYKNKYHPKKNDNYIYEPTNNPLHWQDAIRQCLSVKNRISTLSLKEIINTKGVIEWQKKN